MSYPCVDTTKFDVVDGAVGPKDHLQWRHVARAGADTALYFFPGGSVPPPGILIAGAMVQWTNSTPLSQIVYCVATRGSTRVTSTAPETNLLETLTGVTSGAAPADPVPTSASLMGCKIDMGADPANPPKPLYGVFEVRDGQRTNLLGPNVTLAPGHTMKANLHLYAYNSGTDVDPFWGDIERNIITGAIVLDLFAYPNPAAL